MFRFSTALLFVPAALSAVDFNRDVRPILSDKCFTCHGPDEKQRQVNLRLDTRDGAFADRGGYSLIIPKDSSKSRLIQRVSAERPAMRMPPAASGLKLSEKEIQTLRQWIDEGAEWKTHWSYEPPKRADLPKTSNNAWVRNPIDNFVLARLDKEGLKPSPEADRITLLRRVSLDLIGLPPTPAEIDAFVADRSAGAYEKQIDRLLKSPHYGERMAMQWLDLARYADTHGYHIDSHRDMWPWRDWVIDAFNRNMPFDRFTVEQIAGDLLPDATRSQKIATGFNRNHMINFEGGAIAEEYQTEYVVDRVEATSNVWMAMTTGCARCHDHKYDPIKQKEFYGMFAFFNTVAEKGLDGRYGNAEPVLQLTSAEEQSRLAELKRRIKEVEEALPEDDVAAAQAEWEKTKLASLPEPSRAGLIAHYELDGHFADTSGRYQHGRTRRGEVTYGEGTIGQAAAFSGETQVELGDAAAIDRGDPFTLAFWMRSSAIRATALLQRIDAASARRGWEAAVDEAVTIPDLKRGVHLQFSFIHAWPDKAIRIQTKQRIVQNDWYQVTLVSDASGKAAGLKLYLNGKQAEFDILADDLSGSFRTEAPLSVGDKSLGLPYKGMLDDIRIYTRALESAEIDQLAVQLPIRALLASGPPKRSKDQKDRLRKYFLSFDAPDRLRTLNEELLRLKNEKTAFDKRVPTTMVMEEMEEPRDTHVLGRGDYRNKGEKVTAGVPSMLPPLAPGLPQNRLGFAQWLVDPAHPLTARVAVNRYWQMYFGTGLVKTAEDFGSQGEAPSHPELLDWLATEFVRSAWDVRAMQRLIVTSGAYRQTSKATPELIEKDPENRLLARGPRFRMPAETVRDHALAAAGLLNPAVGGPSVFPYQPKGLWEETAYGDVYSAQSYTPGSGKDLYRRSMYTFWKRTSPPPSLMTFDAPDREKCTARRARTNTPLQALVLMNDPTYVEAARALAERALKEVGSARRIAYAFRRATGRSPSTKEAEALRKIQRKQLTEYRANPQSAEQLLSVGESKADPKLDRAELAAWTTVASVILNLDEVITKE